MATLIGDAFSDSSRFHHNMIAPSPHSHEPHYHHRSHRSASRSEDAPARRSSASPRRQSASSSSREEQRYTASQQRDDTLDSNRQQTSSSSTSSSSSSHRPHHQHQPQQETLASSSSSSEGASRLPSPPDSSSDSETSSAGASFQHGNSPAYMASSSHETAPHIASSFPSTTSSASSAITVVPASTQIPSPESDNGTRWRQNNARDGSPELSSDSPVQTQTTIRVRDLAHIQSLAKADLLRGNGSGILNDPPLSAMKYEISGMPIGDIIEMVAALLTKITTTNDLQHDALNRNAVHVKQAQAAAAKEESGSGESVMSPLSSSVLAFHGKNVPAITILSYLSRIHKYCPTTYEVFLSLLVYFDRMTERVNEMVVKSEEARRAQQKPAPNSQAAPKPSPPAAETVADVEMQDRDDDASSASSDEMDSDLADDDDDDEDDEDGGAPAGKKPERRESVVSTGMPAAASATAAPPVSAQATYFVVDSFNIHRLIIAGVTCASKFFSDVFYTNSRYAKVGGLPLAELNHLELQFLLLNDFRLAVPVEDLEAYATMLVEFYAREVVGQRSRPAASSTE